MGQRKDFSAAYRNIDRKIMQTIRITNGTSLISSDEHVPN